MSESRVPDAVAAAVLDRCGGYCEACTQPMRITSRGDYCFHHRQARQMGGSKARNLDTVVNIVAVHHACHRIIHANPQRARDHNLIVPSWGTPEDSPVIPWPLMR